MDTCYQFCFNTLNNEDSSVVQNFHIIDQNETKYLRAQSQGEKNITCQVKPHILKLLEHMLTLHTALYFSGDKMNTPQKKNVNIKAISCHHPVQEYHYSKNVMLEKTI